MTHLRYTKYYEKLLKAQQIKGEKERQQAISKVFEEIEVKALKAADPMINEEVAKQLMELI